MQAGSLARNGFRGKNVSDAGSECLTTSPFAGTRWITHDGHQENIR